MVVFPGVGQPVPPWFSSSTCSGRETLRISGTCSLHGRRFSCHCQGTKETHNQEVTPFMSTVGLAKADTLSDDTQILLYRLQQVVK